MSSNPFDNSLGSNSAPLVLNFPSRVSHFEEEMKKAAVNPEFNLRHTIYAIIHPFYGNELQDGNMDLYKKIISEVVGNQNSFLYYVATHPDIRDIHDLSKGRGYDFTKEIELQDILDDQPNEVYQRMARLTDGEGYNSWYVPGYNPRGLIDIANSISPSYSPLFWFAQNGVKTYYTSELAKAYTDISGLTKMQRLEIEERSDFGLVAEGNRAFLSVPLHPQVANLIRFLGAGQERVESRYMLALDNDKRKNTNIIASGEKLEDGVFTETMRLAILLGIPLRNVSLNREQPYLSETERERGYFRRPPIDALYPPEHFLHRESSNRGFLR